MTTALACCCADAATSPADRGNVVQLSPFEVTAEKMDFSSWIKVQSPNFVIYTDASGKEATQLAKHFEMTLQAAQFFFRRDRRSSLPVIIVLPTSRSDWRKIKSTNVQWQVTASIREHTRGIVLAEYDWQEQPAPLFAMVGDHAVTLMNLDGPRWFGCGITEFFETVEFDGSTLKIGKQNAMSIALIRGGWMNWPHFFKIVGSSPEYRQDIPAHFQYFGQAAAFTHYLLTSGDSANVERLLRWSALLETGAEPTNENFKQLFGVDFAGMQKRINDLMAGGHYMSSKISFPPEAMKYPITIANVHTPEMRELFVLCRAMVQDTPESGEAIDSLALSGVKNEELREVFVDTCLTHNRKAEALKQLRILIDNGSTNPDVFSEVARVRLEASSEHIDLETRLGSEVEEIERWATRAVELDPLDFRASECLAWAEALGATVTKANVDVISQTCHRLNNRAPTDGALAALAIAHWRMGDTAKVHEITAILLRSPYTRPNSKACALALEQELSSPATTADQKAK